MRHWTRSHYARRTRLLSAAIHLQNWGRHFCTRPASHGIKTALFLLLSCALSLGCIEVCLDRTWRGVEQQSSSAHSFPCAKRVCPVTPTTTKKHRRSRSRPTRVGFESWRFVVVVRKIYTNICVDNGSFSHRTANCESVLWWLLATTSTRTRHTTTMLVHNSHMIAAVAAFVAAATPLCQSLVVWGCMVVFKNNPTCMSLSPLSGIPCLDNNANTHANTNALARKTTSVN